MEEKYLEKLYELLENAKKRNDFNAVAALSWAIFNLEDLLNVTR